MMLFLGPNELQKSLHVRTNTYNKSPLQNHRTPTFCWWAQWQKCSYLAEIPPQDWTATERSFNPTRRRNTIGVVSQRILVRAFTSHSAKQQRQSRMRRNSLRLIASLASAERLVLYAVRVFVQRYTASWAASWLQQLYYASINSLAHTAFRTLHNMHSIHISKFTIVRGACGCGPAQ